MPTMVVDPNSNNAARGADISWKTNEDPNKKDGIIEQKCPIEAFHEGSEVRKLNFYEDGAKFLPDARSQLAVLQYELTDLADGELSGCQLVTHCKQKQKSFHISKKHKRKWDKWEHEYGTHSQYPPLIPESPSKKRQRRGENGKAVWWADDAGPRCSGFIFHADDTASKRQQDEIAKDKIQGNHLIEGGSNGENDYDLSGHNLDECNTESLFKADTEVAGTSTSLITTPSSRDSIEFSADEIVLSPSFGHLDKPLATNPRTKNMNHLLRFNQLYGIGRKAGSRASNRKDEITGRSLDLSGLRPGAKRTVKKADFVRSRSVSPEPDLMRKNRLRMMTRSKWSTSWMSFF